MEENSTVDPAQQPQPVQQTQPTDPNTTQPPPSTDSDTNTIVCVLLLLFIYPIGLIFMWFATKWPKWVKILVTAPIILAILGIVLAVFLATLDPSSKVEEARSRAVRPTTSFPVDETANWKTYENNEIGISFKYPSGQIELSQTDNNYYLNIVESKSSPFSYFSFDILKGDQAATAAGLLNNIISGKVNDYNKYSSPKIVKVGENDFHYYTKLFDPTTKALPPVGGPANAFNAGAMIDGTFYRITSYDFTNSDATRINEGWAEEEKQFKQILSTLKFLDETANWKTYTSKNFSIKYPEGWIINDQSYTSGSLVYIGFALQGPLRSDIAEASGKNAHYLRAVFWDKTSNILMPNKNFDSSGEIFIFQREQGDQAIDDVPVSGDFILTSKEHVISEKILSTFKFTN